MNTVTARTDAVRVYDILRMQIVATGYIMPEIV